MNEVPVMSIIVLLVGCALRFAWGTA